MNSENVIYIFQAISKENFFILYNGRYVTDLDVLFTGSATITPRLFGGKGGFGSMLRAIGAQIEKTTNREACRDLSGRRLRDINEEKRLKLWMEKQAKRAEEAEERKKKKLEKLCSEPKHEFKDQQYDKERSALIERVSDAVEEGFKATTSSNLKRTTETELENIKKKRKITLGFGLDLDSDELDSSDDDSNNDSQTEKRLSNEQNLENALNKETETISSDEVFINDKNDTNDVTYVQLIDNSEKPPISEENLENSSVNIINKESKSDEDSTNDETDFPDVSTVEKSKLAVSN